MLPNSRMLSSRPWLLGLLAVVVVSGVAQAQPASTVIDGAGMFSDDAVRKAKSELSRIDRTHGVAVTIETVTSLKGDTIDEVGVRRAEKLGHKGIFVLIAEKEHKVEALASPRSLLEELGKARLNEIRDAFTADFKERKFDEGLMKGVQTADRVLGVVKRSMPDSPAPASTSTRPTTGGFLPTTISTPAATSAGHSSLVVREQVRLSLLGARKLIEGAEAKALKEGWKMNISVVDEGGHLLAFERMDGARPASVATSMTKAVSAATFRQPTGPVVGTTSPGVADVLLNVGIQNASGGKITTLLGGVPITVDGQVIGAIGVGGGSGEQDLETARAGIAAFVAGLQVKAEESKPKETDTAKPKDGEPDAAKPKDADTTPKP